MDILLISHANTYLIFLSLLHKGQLDTFHTSTPPEPRRGVAAPFISADLFVWEHLGTFKQEACIIKKLLIKDHPFPENCENAEAF